MPLGSDGGWLLRCLIASAKDRAVARSWRALPARLEQAWRGNALLTGAVVLCLPERDHVVAAHEGYRSLAFQCFYRGITSIPVGAELLIPDMACSLMVDDFERPCLVFLQAVDLDRKRIAVHQNPLAFTRRDEVWIFIVSHVGSQSDCISGSILCYIRARHLKCCKPKPGSAPLYMAYV